MYLHPFWPTYDLDSMFMSQSTNIAEKFCNIWFPNKVPPHATTETQSMHIKHSKPTLKSQVPNVNHNPLNICDTTLRKRKLQGTAT